MAARKRHLQQGDGMREESADVGNERDQSSQLHGQSSRNANGTGQHSASDEKGEETVLYITKFQKRLLIMCGTLLILLVAVALGMMWHESRRHWTPDPEVIIEFELCLNSTKELES